MVQLLSGMNETTAAFADLHGRRLRSSSSSSAHRRHVGRPALHRGSSTVTSSARVPSGRALSATRSRKPLSRPTSIKFVHPEDRAQTDEAARVLYASGQVARWSSRTARRLSRTVRRAGSAGDPSASIVRARVDVRSGTRRDGSQAPRGRGGRCCACVATLAAGAVAPTQVFDAVTGEVGLQCDADVARLERFERDGTVTVVAAWSRSGRDRAGGRRPLRAGRDEHRRPGGEDRPAGAGGQLRGCVRAGRT